MQDSFDLLEYLEFLRARWKFAAVACGIAVLVAIGASLMLPKRYTVTATILIDPPAGADPRTATAVSTVYLESLKTYELLAENDQLFVQAASRFHLRQDENSSIESLKRRVLKVDKPRDTRAIEISVTLGDPKTAQAVAQFIADGVVALSRSGSKEAGDAMLDDAAKAAELAQARLTKAQADWQSAAGASGEEALRSEIFDDGELKSRAEEQLLDEQSKLAELEGQEKQRARQAPAPSNAQEQSSGGRQDTGASRARMELLQRRVAELTRTITAKSAELARQTARQEDMEAALKGARSSYESAAQRLADLPVTLGSRSEWLRVVDPGIVPQRPSSPNAPLILIGSVALALFSSLLYLTVAFSLMRSRRHYNPGLRMATHGDD